MLSEAIKKIEAQQAKLGKSPAYWVGEQLKDMLRAEPWNADLVARDLEAVDPKGRWALVRFTVAGGSYLECFFPSEILKVG